MRRLGLVLLFGLALFGPATDGRADFDDDDHPAGSTSRDDYDAVRTCHSPWGVRAQALRRAILRVARIRSCQSVDALAAIVDDTTRDTVTRGMAALALGEIACRRTRSGRRDVDADGLSAAAIASLETATLADSPAGLRQAAVRALGRASAASAQPTLATLRNDQSPIVRYLAAQALTRITRTDQFDAAFRDQVVVDVIAGALGYTITDEAPAGGGAP